MSDTPVALQLYRLALYGINPLNVIVFMSLVFQPPQESITLTIVNAVFILSPFPAKLLLIVSHQGKKILSQTR